MKTLGEVVKRHQTMLDWVLLGEAADDRRSWIFPAVLDGESGIKRVSNLGWLLKHNSEIVHPYQGITFFVKGWRYGESRYAGMHNTGPLMATTERFRPILLVNMNDGRTFACQFEDASVLRDWLERPSFKGYLIDWEINPGPGIRHTLTTIGSAEYRQVDVRQRVPIL